MSNDFCITISFRIPLKESLTVNFIEKKFNEIISTVEESNEFYFKNTKPYNFLDDTNNNGNELSLTHGTEKCQLKIGDFNFMTVYLFEDFYHSQTNNVSFKN